MAQLFDAEGRPIALGRELGRGGEGAVFELARDGGFVAKIYHESVEARRVRKFTAMARLATPNLLKIAAWPIGTLHSSPGGTLVGLVMPRVVGHREIHELYSPAQRKLHFPKANWAYLVHVAMNCASAFEVVHAAGHVVGDVNQSGVMVGERATIQLIDCDSFQIRGEHELFPCVVGVPQYTPPELQGQNFRDVIRTPDHDCFGLALLIFHLLFMGRHPFAGRFAGQGDMPIEKAISEGRFAFSRRASQLQMAPPPNTLPLEALPGDVANLFESAFAFPRRTPRPSAARWREAMTALKAKLRTCPADKGHLYPATLPACPWCGIMRLGGPNFFATVSGDPSAVDVPYVNVAALWGEIEAVAAPPFSPGPPPLNAFKPVGRPLPEGLADLLLFRRLSALTAGGGLALAICNLSTPLDVIGLILFALFGLVCLVLNFVGGLGRERSERRYEVARCKATLRPLLDHWKHANLVAQTRFYAYKKNLAADRDAAARVHVDFQKEIHDLESRAREDQLYEFLDRYLIGDVKLPGIGPGRLAALRSFGIETAADLDPFRLQAVRGIGDTTIGELLKWRTGLESQFHYDPRQGVPPARRAQVVHKYIALKRQYEMRLREGAQQLREIQRDITQQITTLTYQIHAIELQLRQAEADLKRA